MQSPICSHLQAGSDSYPLIGRMEIVTFGQAKPTEAVEERLTKLEQAIFLLDYKDQSLFDRTQKLKSSYSWGLMYPIDENQDLDFAALPPLLNMSPGLVDWS